MSALMYANILAKKGQINNAISVYNKIRSSHSDELQKQIDWNINYYTKKLPPHISPPSADIDITLTTIRARLSAVVKVIQSLHEQTIRPRSINLYISSEAYLLDEGISRDELNQFDFHSFDLLKINFVKNTGPYRKIMPYLENYFSCPDKESQLFITVDDDTLYPSDFIETLYNSYLQHKCVIAFRGRKISFENNQIAAYHKWLPGEYIPSLLNVPTGKDGVLYCTSFFTKDFFDELNAFSIAPTADDLWIKWHTYGNGIASVIINPDACLSDYKSFPLVSYDKEFRDISLYQAHNSGLNGNNDVTIKKLELCTTPIKLISKIEI